MCQPLQANKVYVQDRLRDSGDLVWRLLEVRRVGHAPGRVSQQVSNCSRTYNMVSEPAPRTPSGSVLGRVAEITDTETVLQAGGHFYVCGDAAHMAGAVESALLDVIKHHQAR